MDKIISPNQTSFIKGRTISDNVMLTQELVHNIRKPNSGGNIILKLDMANAFDRVDWDYLSHVMRQMGFDEGWIGMIMRTLSNNWYSININGARHGWFKSSRGLKQGDPISPSLFAISAEFLSRLMDQLVLDNFIPYSIYEGSPLLTHLSYADDTILFSSGDLLSISMMMKKLETYELISGQMVNKRKSSFLVSPKTTQSTIEDIKAITVNKVQGWQGKLLSVGGRAVLIKSVLHSLPIHIMAVLHPPKTTLDQINKVLANFFWGQSEDDEAIWIANQNGKFFTKSAWKNLRNPNNITLTGKKIWLNKLTFRVSFFMMRLLKGKLPTDDSLIKFGVHGPSMCYCCSRKNMETINHLFANGELASNIWGYFSNACGIPLLHGDIRTMVMRWWLLKPKNKVHDLILQCLPSNFLWEIWKSRCSHKYEGIRFYSRKVTDQVTHLMRLILIAQFPSINFPPTMPYICELVDKLKPKLDIKLVRWIKPPQNQLKLNVDGCSKGNPRSAGAGSILRDHTGHMIMAFAVYLGNCSNNMAEILSLKIGLRWCLQHGFISFSIESDLLLVIQMVKGNITPFWQIREEITQVQNMTSQGFFQLERIFREGNLVADQLANLGERNKQKTFFIEDTTLPKQIKSTMKNEVNGSPTFRVRVKKGVFIFYPG
ncbi:uncharacterized protein [Nicotiana sylvestris]|uniref:uncharacterized protein n=1 Tax=Nicotiana sylvestris TaxID=4096 RepID=UPI00388C6A6C